MSHQGRHTADLHNTHPAAPQLQCPPAAMSAGDIYLDFKADHAGEDDVWHGMTDAAWDRMSVAELFDAAEEKIRLI